jgi:hypothetical protein
MTKTKQPSGHKKQTCIVARSMARHTKKHCTGRKKAAGYKTGRPDCKTGKTD